MRFLVFLAVIATGTAWAQTAPRSVGKDLVVKELPDLAGREALVRANTYPPGTSNPPHRHDAHVFLHLLEGQLIVQLKGGQPVTLNPGEYVINEPGTWHTADVEKAATAVFITAGLGTEHRPR